MISPARNDGCRFGRARAHGLRPSQGLEAVRMLAALAGAAALAASCGKEFTPGGEGGDAGSAGTTSGTLTGSGTTSSGSGSPTGTGGTGGTGGSVVPSGGADPGVGCEQQYGAIPGLALWCNHATECAFVFNGYALSCYQVCRNHGGECLQAWESLGACSFLEDWPCGNVAGTYVVCVCSLGCETEVPCSLPFVCEGGICEMP